MTDKHILVIGSGSAGKRHARNLSELGCRISCVDPRTDRRDELSQEVKVVGSYGDEAAALAAARYDGVVIGSPPHVHVRQAIAALEAGCPVLLEKPVAPDLDSAECLAQVADSAAVPLLLGYTWRWWPPLGSVRRSVAEGAVGKMLHVQFHMSAHLADWHPWEPYQEFFMAHRDLGGGALLDESHWIDLMLWLFGMPREVSGRIEKLSDLQIDSDDNVDLLFAYDSGLRVTMHLDLFGRPHEKFIRFIGSDGTILWSADPNQTAIGRSAAQDWQREEFDCERNDMFIGVAKEFLDVIEGVPIATCTIQDGVNVLKVIEAARAASSERRGVSLS